MPNSDVYRLKRKERHCWDGEERVKKNKGKEASVAVGFWTQRKGDFGATVSTTLVTGSREGKRKSRVLAQKERKEIIIL